MLSRAQIQKFQKVYRLYCRSGGLVYREFPTEQEMVAASTDPTLTPAFHREVFHRAWVVRVTGDTLVRRIGAVVGAGDQADHYYLTEKDAKRAASLWKLTGAEAQVITRDMWPNGERVL